VPGLGATLGRGGATTAPQDLVNADAILIVGSSMAEAHPVAFRWVVTARERGALVIHVDPRFSRTSAAADLWAPVRAGSDIVFLGALINYVLTHDRVFREYVAAYTNAPILIREDYRGPEDLEGLFSGWQPDTRRYDTSSWQYDRDAEGHPRQDPTMQHPRCVYQHLVRHFARYSPELVERVCGMPREAFLEIADRYTACSGPDRTGTICYAVGLTQHSVGAQVVRSVAILQLLLGNVGRPGGGILALRGHASIQGSTDIPTLYDPARRGDGGARSLACAQSKVSRRLGALRCVSGQPAQGVVRRRGNRGERLRLRMAAAHLRRSLPPGLLARDG
jgi:formate dehydrogenase major subunit